MGLSAVVFCLRHFSEMDIDFPALFFVSPWRRLMCLPGFASFSSLLNSSTTKWNISISLSPSSSSPISISRPETDFRCFRDVTSAAGRALGYFRSAQEGGDVLRFSTALIAWLRLLAF